MNCEHTKIWDSLFKIKNIHNTNNNNVLNKLSEYTLNGREIRNYMKLIYMINKNVNAESIYKTFKTLYEINNKNNSSYLSLYT